MPSPVLLVFLLSPCLIVDGSASTEELLLSSAITCSDEVYSFTPNIRAFYDTFEIELYNGSLKGFRTLEAVKDGHIPEINSKYFKSITFQFSLPDLTLNYEGPEGSKDIKSISLAPNKFVAKVDVWNPSKISPCVFQVDEVETVLMPKLDLDLNFSLKAKATYIPDAAKEALNAQVKKLVILQLKYYLSITIEKGHGGDSQQCATTAKCEMENIITSLDVDDDVWTSNKDDDKWLTNVDDGKESASVDEDKGSTNVDDGKGSTNVNDGRDV